MSNMSLLNVIEALSEVSPVDHFRNEMMIGEVNGTYIRFLQKGGLLPTNPFRLDDLLLILVEEGSAQINVDYAPCAIEAHSCVTLMPSHVIQVEWVSESFKGQVLVVSRSFLDRYQAEGMRRGSVANYMTVRKHPITPLEPEEQALLAEGDTAERALLPPRVVAVGLGLAADRAGQYLWPSWCQDGRQSFESQRGAV